MSLNPSSLTDSPFIPFLGPLRVQRRMSGGPQLPLVSSWESLKAPFPFRFPHLYGKIPAEH